MKKVRIGDFGFLSEPFPKWLTIELVKAVGEDYEVKLYDLLVKLKAGIDEATDNLQREVEYIIQKAEGKGVPLSVYPVSCHRASCMTCLGVYQNHYPYFSNSGHFVRKEEEESFLIGLEMTREEIENYKVTRDCRTQLIQVYHTLITVSNHMGLSKITLKTEET